MKYFIVSDFFVEDFVGGAALNDEEILKIFLKNGQDIEKIKSEEVSIDFLEKNSQAFYIVSNFLHIPEDSLEKLKTLNYVIYAHDYKFVRHMNPAGYEDFKVPEEELIYVDFYQKSQYLYDKILSS